MRENDEVGMTNDEIESLLGKLVPDAPNVNRDALMYQAGYQAACGLANRRGANYFWKATTGLMTAATVALAVMLARGEAPQAPSMAKVESPVHEENPAHEPQVVVAHAPSPAPASAADGNNEQELDRRTSPLLLVDPSSNYLALRAALLERGVETWPTDYREPASPHNSGETRRTSTVRDLLQEVLPTAPEPREDDQPQPTEASIIDEETII